MPNLHLTRSAPETGLAPFEPKVAAIESAEIARLSREIEAEQEVEARKQQAAGQVALEARLREEARAARRAYEYD